MLIALKGLGARNTAKLRGGGAVPQGKMAMSVNSKLDINFI
jgi:hypothetical protein